MYSYFAPLNPQICPDGGNHSRPGLPRRKAGPVKATETQVDAFSCPSQFVHSPVGGCCVLLTIIKGRSAPETKSEPYSTEGITFDQAMHISDWTTEDQPNNIPRFLPPFIDLPLAGIFEGILSDVASWSSRSERAIQTEDSGVTTGRSTPFTDRSDVPSFTTIETRLEQKGLSSIIWAWFGWKEDTSSRRTLEIKEENSDRLGSSDDLPCCVRSTLKCESSAGGGPRVVLQGAVESSHCVETISPTTDSHKEAKKVEIQGGETSSAYDGGEAVQNDWTHLYQNSNTTVEEEEYWRWDQGIQQFVHTDRDTGKAMVCPDWFD